MMEEQMTNDDLKKAPKTENVLTKSRPIRPVYNRTWRTSVLIITFHQKSSEAEGKPEGEIFNMHIPYGIPFCGVSDMMMKMGFGLVLPAKPHRKKGKPDLKKEVVT